MGEQEHQKWIEALQKRTGESDKNWAVAVLLSSLLGYLGADRFYLGYMESAVLKAVTLGGLGWWWLWDLALVITGSLPDADGFRLRRQIRVTPGLVALVSLVVVGGVLLLVSLAMVG